jgi:hypothetical protein
LPGTSPPRPDHWGSCPDGPASPATRAATTEMRGETISERTATKFKGGRARRQHLDVVRLLDLGLGGRRAHFQHIVVPRLPYHRTTLLLSSLRALSAPAGPAAACARSEPPGSPAAARRPPQIPSARVVVRDSERVRCEVAGAAMLWRVAACCLLLLG